MKMKSPLGPIIPAKDRDEVPETGETLAGRTAMQAPGMLMERAEGAEERADVAAEERAEVVAEERAEEMEEAMEGAIEAVARAASLKKKKKQWHGRLAAKK